MNYSSRAVSLIKEFEGFKAFKYKDGNNQAIGYGTTVNSSNEHLISEPISPKEAEKLLRTYADQVLSQIDKTLKVQINQNQIDALVSFGYNLGAGTAVKMVHLINAQKSDSEVAEKMKEYVYANGEKLFGLERRRKAEADLFLKPFISPLWLLTGLLLLYALVK